MAISPTRPVPPGRLAEDRRYVLAEVPALFLTVGDTGRSISGLDRAIGGGPTVQVSLVPSLVAIGFACIAARAAGHRRVDDALVVARLPGCRSASVVRPMVPLLARLRTHWAIAAVALGRALISQFWRDCSCDHHIRSSRREFVRLTGLAAGAAGSSIAIDRAGCRPAGRGPRLPTPCSPGCSRATSGL